ncbi:uncharacterized protein LOC118203359 [Stegodyphus dumicola]|uniref:uncharacterized protein LOC118203359 n=1 Tax=Stegodyphus dumicola TaxID=202533 RepID=UPI0015A7D025|nr:uncharacterized protein LOC118203359 [Stegodyphus dumicola]
MANQESSPKLLIDGQQTFVASESLTNEAETSLTERCGYCNKPKRPEKSQSSPENTHLCQCPSASESTDPNIRLGTVPSSAFRRSPSPRPSLVPSPGRSNATLGIQSDGGKVEIVSIREKHGFFRKAIPHMPLPLAVFLCLLNVLLPGTGVILNLIMDNCFCLETFFLCTS